jgi:hypothetical protein
MIIRLSESTLRDVMYKAECSGEKVDRVLALLKARKRGPSPTLSVRTIERIREEVARGVKLKIVLMVFQISPSLYHRTVRNLKESVDNNSKQPVQGAPTQRNE